MAHRVSRFASYNGCVSIEALIQINDFLVVYFYARKQFINALSKKKSPPEHKSSLALVLLLRVRLALLAHNGFVFPLRAPGSPQLPACRRRCVDRTIATLPDRAQTIPRLPRRCGAAASGTHWRGRRALKGPHRPSPGLHRRSARRSARRWPPCNSALLHIYATKLNDISTKTHMVSVDEIKCKLVTINLDEDSMLVIPLLHTLDN